MEQQSQTISPSTAIIAIAATFVFFIFAAAFLLDLFGVEVALIVSEPLLIVIPLGYMLHRKINVRSYIGLDAKPLHIVSGILLGVVVLVFDILITIVLVFVFGGPSEAIEESNKQIVELSASPSGLVAVIASLSLAGICEEFTFRGFLQTAINSKYSFAIALFVSSLSFGLFHVDVQGLYTISAFLMGLVLGLIYHRFHSYTVSAITHSTLNLIVLATLLLG